jgi:hypothetical protein
MRNSNDDKVKKFFKKIGRYGVECARPSSENVSMARPCERCNEYSG